MILVMVFLSGHVFVEVDGGVEMGRTGTVVCPGTAVLIRGDGYYAEWSGGFFRRVFLKGTKVGIAGQNKHTSTYNSTGRVKKGKHNTTVR